MNDAWRNNLIHVGFKFAISPEWTHICTNNYAHLLEHVLACKIRDKFKHQLEFGAFTTSSGTIFIYLYFLEEYYEIFIKTITEIFSEKIE